MSTASVQPDPAPAPAAPDDDSGARRFELLAGLTLAVFAAVLAVVDLGGGKYGDDEIIGTNEKASLYQWYQSKSIKQAIVEQQQGLLTALLDAGAVAPAGIGAVTAQIAAADRFRSDGCLGGNGGEILAVFQPGLDRSGLFQVPHNNLRGPDPRVGLAEAGMVIKVILGFIFRNADGRIDVHGDQLVEQHLFSELFAPVLISHILRDEQIKKFVTVVFADID
ncbi:MAG: DUF4337 family protein [Pseudomonadota bacterium]|nr:DUF4337 family protein [Pseudomonadota bacterium]